MKTQFAVLSACLLMLASSVEAQDPAVETSPVYAPSTVPSSPTTVAPAPENEKGKRKVYNKKVGGLLWFEGTVGWARVEPNSLKTLKIDGSRFEVSEDGIEYGAALGVQLGWFTIGGRFKTAKLDSFDFNTLGVDIGFLLRFVPYVHPFFRVQLNYNFTSDGLGLGDRYSNVQADGGGGSIGGGLRIPIIKWISMDAVFDYSAYGLYVRGTETSSGNSFKKGTAGNELSISGALTFHFIQRHKR